jgi:HEAT repeat protein
MDSQFTPAEVGKLFEYALETRDVNAAGLALKAARITGCNSYAHLAAAIEKSSLYQFAIANGITQFARYDQLNLVIELLQSDSSKVRLAIIACLELLKDPLALDHLYKLAHHTNSEVEKQRADLAYQKISANPISLHNNTFYTPSVLTPLQDLDLAFAELILGRELFDKDITVLVGLLAHPMKELRTKAASALIRKGTERADEFFDALANNELPVTIELIKILTHYKSLRGGTRDY